MANDNKQSCCEKFKTTIGGQALIEGILMRGPEKDAIVVRGKDGLTLEVSPRKIRKPGSVATWPLIRGAVGFLDSQKVGVKALMRSADLAPEEYAAEEQPSKFDQWLDEKLGNEKSQKFIIGFAVFFGIAMSVGLFFLLPAVISGFFDRWITNNLALTLVEGLVRMSIFTVYMVLIGRMKSMERVFAYHGAEHKTIRCYEAGLPLTVENVRTQTRLHPRCGTSFLLVVMVISILVFSVASALLLSAVPELEEMRGTVGYRLLMIGYKLLLLPLIVGITYEINRWVGRHDNAVARILGAPGMWMQKISTKEPDDSMIEVAITAVEAVLPEKEGSDRW